MDTINYVFCIGWATSAFIAGYFTHKAVNKPAVSENFDGILLNHVENNKLYVSQVDDLWCVVQLIDGKMVAITPASKSLREALAHALTGVQKNG